MHKPKTLLIELTDRCNAQCVMCGRSWWKRKPRDMAFKDYRTVLDAVSNCVDKVHPLQYGEPLLYKQIVEAVAYAKNMGKYVWITTNASLLDRSMSRMLIATGLDKIIFSIDAIEEKMFEVIRPGLKWKTVIANIDQFVNLNKNTEVVVNLVHTKENTSVTKNEVREFWKRHGIKKVAFSPEVDVSPLNRLWTNGRPFACDRIVNHLTVRSDGSVVLCCRDCHGTYTMGNAIKSDPLTVFNSLKFTVARKAIASGNGFPAICKGCRDPKIRKPVRPNV